jgi:hypothetical protein
MNTNHTHWRANWLTHEWARLLHDAWAIFKPIPTTPTWITPTRPGTMHQNGIIDPDQQPPAPAFRGPLIETINIPMLPSIQYDGQNISITPTSFDQINERLGPTHVQAIKEYRTASRLLFIIRKHDIRINPEAPHNQIKAALTLEKLIK